MIYLVRGRRKSERLRVGLRAWLRQRQIEDVGGRYGFAGVKESDNWAEVRWGRRTQIELKQWRKLIGTEVCGLACLSDCGWSSDWREGEGRALCLSLLLVSGHSWAWRVCVRSVWGLCEECKTIEGKIRTKMVLLVRRGFFYSQRVKQFLFDPIFCRYQTHTRL